MELKDYHTSELLLELQRRGFPFEYSKEIDISVVRIEEICRLKDKAFFSIRNSQKRTPKFSEMVCYVLKHMKK